MPIIFSKETGEFHLYNQDVSYIMQILKNGQIGSLYYGRRIRHREDFSHLLEGGISAGHPRSMSAYEEGDASFLSMQHTKQEYPCAGRGDFREPAFVLEAADESRIFDFRYESHEIFAGKKKLEGLPAVYTQDDGEAQTLEIALRDTPSGMRCILSYSIFRDFPAIARSVRFCNDGTERCILRRVMSASVDLPDSDYDLLYLTGAWARERHVKNLKLEEGLHRIGSTRGSSSGEYNPFLALKRPGADEMSGEVLGFSLIYSGNHLEQAEADTFGTARVQLGIHPAWFDWELAPGETFQSPEAVLVYTRDGLNGMSQTYHELYRTHLARGVWRDKERPLVINNWEATGAAFTEEKVLEIARRGKELGLELFVLDDGWFGERDDDTKGLGDWYVTNKKKLPGGIEGLSEKIHAMGMRFGLWFEPEMVNPDSNLYRAHPDWILYAPGHRPLLSRYQYVLDFSRREVRDYLYEKMEAALSNASVDYVKWDMNRYLTECYSAAAPAGRQGQVMHRYVLGVYELYERLIERFPAILFESCSAGGARFDPGMLYYAPQAWTSDDTDALERILIQYGTSYVYPLSMMAAHVSDVPNMQTGRITPLSLRGNVAMFGMFGCEMDLNTLDEEECLLLKRQIAFVKRYRELVMKGRFYRLKSPFAGDEAAWMVINDNQSEALIGYYLFPGSPNGSWRRIRLAGLSPEKEYTVSGREGRTFFGDELMNAGLLLGEEALIPQEGGCFSKIFVVSEKES